MPGACWPGPASSSRPDAQLRSASGLTPAPRGFSELAAELVHASCGQGAVPNPAFGGPFMRFVFWLPPLRPAITCIAAGVLQRSVAVGFAVALCLARWAGVASAQALINYHN